MNCDVFGPQIPGCIFPFFVCLRSVVSFILFKMLVMSLYFTYPQANFDSFSQSSNLPYPPNKWPSYPTHFHDCAIHIYASIFCGSRDLLSEILVCRDCHHLVLLHFFTFQEENNRIRRFIAYPLHGAAHTFRFFLNRKGRSICSHTFLAI